MLSQNRPSSPPPDLLLEKLGVSSQDIIQNRKEFSSDTVHTEWMNHVHDVLPEISRGEKKAIVKTHTTLLFIKDKLDKTYFGDMINKREYTAQLAGLMKWFQKANRSVLSKEEYNTLFGIPNSKAEMAISPDELGFPIQNPETTIEMIKNKFDDRLIIDLTRFYQEQSQELRDIKKIYDTGDFRGTEAKQVKKDMQRTERELYAAFMNYCRDILSGEQFQLLFGSPKNK